MLYDGFDQIHIRRNANVLRIYCRYDRRHGSRDRHDRRHHHGGGGGGGPGSVTGGDTDRDTVVSIRSAPPTQHPGHARHLNHGGVVNGDGEGGERIEVGLRDL